MPASTPVRRGVVPTGAGPGVLDVTDLHGVAELEQTGRSIDAPADDPWGTRG